MRESGIIACDARGGWPGTYDTDSVAATKTFHEKQAIFLTGGDVFGFDVAAGIRRFLVEKELASYSGAGKLPAIVGACIYDLEFADIQNVSYPELGYEACLNASAEPMKEGNIGAGLGASVGKLRGQRYASKSGVGSSVVHILGNIVVGVLVVNNAMGNVFDIHTGKTIAGVRNDRRLDFLEMDEITEEYLSTKRQRKRATTIGVVATNLVLDHEQVVKMAEVAHNGLAMSIRPVHTSLDGDTLFAVSTKKVKWSGSRRILDVIGYHAAEQVRRAVIRSVKTAKTLRGVPGLA